MLALLAALLLASPADGKATIVQGSVEAKPANAEFAALTAGMPVAAGTTLRSGAGGKALIEFGGGYELRLNEKTEIVLETDKKMLLVKGRVYFKVPKASAPVQIATDLHPMTLDACVADITYTPRVPNGAPAATAFMVLEGKMQAFSKKFSPVITSGWVATGYGSQLNTPDTIRNMAIDTEWVHSLLVARGTTDEETAMRTDELIAILAKENPDPAEPPLRSLGELAAPGISKYLAKSVLETQVKRRAVAATALADAATIKSAPLLLPLLSHKEAGVRLQGGRGLARLAGKDLGYGEEFWKGDKVEAGVKAWEEWLKQNAK
jgi:hypothetical protein